MSTSETCEYCGNPLPLSCEECPHCAQPGLFPNVRMANSAEERSALDDRYQRAIADATLRGCEDIIRQFEGTIESSLAVIARSLEVLEWLAESDCNIYTTYDQMVEAGSRIPSGDKWDPLRASAEAAIYPTNKKKVRYAALALGDAGLRNYGNCFLFLQSELIAHRATVFEENCVLFMDHQGIKMSDADKIPKGYRAMWEERTKLCIAKLARKIDRTTTADQFSQILLYNGTTTGDDDFVEVHIWGSMTSRTLQRVIVTGQPKRKRLPVKLKILQEKLAKVGVSFETMEPV